MAIQYINVPEIDFGRGIDARSAENQIGEGFVRDLLNADVIQKNVRKRTGYQGYAGNVPVRVTRLDYIASSTPKQIRFTLDTATSINSSVSLVSVQSSPLVVYGKVSEFATGSGPITTTNTAKYYDKFKIPIRKPLVNTFPGEGTYAIPGSEHGLNTTNFFCNVVESTDTLYSSYEDIDVTSISINNSSYDVTLTYALDGVPSTEAIVYYKNEVSSPGNNYIETLSHSGGGLQSYTINASTHNLKNSNIIYQLYQQSGSNWVQCNPNTFRIDFTGNVIIEIINTIGSPGTTYKVILSTCDVKNIKNTTLTSESQSITISGITSPWIFYSVYSVEFSSRLQVFPNSVQYNDLTKELTLNFLNLPAGAQQFVVYYEYGNIRSNVLYVEDDAVTANGYDILPQITLWGLDHSEIYTTKVSREGWTTHLDTYRRSGEQRVVCGLGGNLFSAQEYNEAASTYLYPTLYPLGQSRTGPFVQRVGRLFYDTGDMPYLSRGWITTSGGGTGWVGITSVQYDPNYVQPDSMLPPNTGWTKYTLHVPNMNLAYYIGGPNGSIGLIPGCEDLLTVTNMSNKKHEGTFKIKSIAFTSNTIWVWVDNPNINSSDWDDLNAGGRGGVFTDSIYLSNAALTGNTYTKAISGDTLIFNETDLSTVYSSNAVMHIPGPTLPPIMVEYATVCGPFESVVEIPINSTVTIRRTSSVIPMRTGQPNISESVTNLVKGDMLSFTGIERELRIKSINADIDRKISISISTDRETVTATLQSGNTSYLSTGQKVILISAGNYSGAQTIANIISATQFTFNVDPDLYESSGEFYFEAILSGKTVEVDEELTWEDSVGDANKFQVARRWIPIEAPADTFNQTPSTYVRHFDSAEYSAQPFIRSTMVADNLYLTNGRDEIMKFDGEHIYRAGLPAWQPGLFATKDTSLANKIVVPKPRFMPYTVANASELIAYKARGELPISAANVEVLPVGTRCLIDGITAPYTVRGYQDKSSGGGSHTIQFDRALDDSTPLTGTISEVMGEYKYYFRLNAVDANDNIIASTMTSSDDMAVQMTENAAIRLKLVGMPPLDNYDYDRIEIEIYRTKLLTGSTAPVFYKIVTLGPTGTPSHNFNRTTGYLEYIDDAADADLTQMDLLSSVAGAELGIGWSDPLRAKYITSTNNRLVLGNVRDYPEFDIQIEGPANLISNVFAGDSLLFKKNYADPGTTTDMVNRVKFEWKSSFTGNVSSFATNTNQFTFKTSGITYAVPGDWIYLAYSTVASSGRDLTYSGWWQIFSVTPRPSPEIGDIITVSLVGASAVSFYPDKYVIADDPTNVPVYLGPDGNLGQINGDVLSTTSETFDATRRMALAINSVMRMTNPSISGYSDFRPWLVARSGNDVVRAGRMVVRVPHRTDALPSVVPEFSGYSLYVNSLPAKTLVASIASERVYPSRILVSYQNYPELFDNPTAILDADSLSAIDINPADGQEITGVIPFFGEAAFTAAQQAGILVVFKTNSIYLVDVNQKVSGSNLVVQRLETQGLGCTAPYSISVTKNGIMFANNSGIYCLRRDQAIEYIGKFMERNWGSKVDKDALSLAQGHHYSVGRMYKLSVPIVGTENETTGYIEPSQVYVYNHTQEDEENHLGAWSRYDNHTAIGWANLASDAFWASTGGMVYILRTTGTETDFRDSNQPIVFRLDTRPNDYGNSGIRKILDKVVVSYRAAAATAQNNLSFSVDLEQEYSPTTPFRIAGTAENLTGFDDPVQKDVITLRHSLDRRRGVYFSIRIENSSLDQNIEPAGLDYRIGGLDSKGIKSASKT